MEEDRRINTWEEFEEAVEKFYSKVKESKDKFGNDAVFNPLFRGQSNEDIDKRTSNGKHSTDERKDSITFTEINSKPWELESTLNRLQKDFPVEKYHWKIQKIKSDVESCTSKRWQLTEDSGVVAKAMSGPSPINIEKDLEFYVYLRHSGFPSPLLDWTRSPYVATFFAFNEDKKSNPTIFMYNEDMGGGKAGNLNEATICSIGPNVTTHKRHHLQQCQYTYCIKEIDGTRCYTSHEDAFSIRETESIVDPDYFNQDYCEKYTLPYKQRANFLSKLNSMNINAYSLFETEEGLMNKLAIEEFLIRNI